MPPSWSRSSEVTAPLPPLRGGRGGGEGGRGHADKTPSPPTPLPRSGGEGSKTARGQGMSVPEYLEFFIDPHRCIGCQACVHACSECDTHRGHPMIHLEYVDRGTSTQTVPVVCMHCDSPTCADVCPADAIKRSGDGRVMTARKPRCI